MAALATSGAVLRPSVPPLAIPRAGGRLDPRLYQIAILSGLLAYGLARLDLEVRPGRARP